jgi:hypothetical protein
MFPLGLIDPGDHPGRRLAMKIFLAGIIQGSHVEAKIHEQDWRTPITAALERHLPEADVYCHYSIHPKSITYEMPDIRQTFKEGLQEARECDVLVAWLPSASMGTAIEMYEAFRSGAVILVISPMSSNWVVRLYSHKIFPGLEAFEKYLVSGELQPLIQAVQAAARKAGLRPKEQNGTFKAVKPQSKQPIEKTHS